MWRWLMNVVITSLIFFPEKTFYELPEHYDLEAEDVFLKTSDGVRLHGWYLPVIDPKGVFVFFHGNAGNISNRLYKVKGWIDRGYSVFLVDYRGYGKSEGNVNHENDILEDAQTAFHWIVEEKGVPPSKVIVYGESLGTYPAIRVASEHRVAAVILEAPFTSFVDLAKVHYPLVPAFVMKDFQFLSKDYIAKLKAPLFILHGTSDEICPYTMAGELFEQAPNPKEFFTIPHGDHNSLPMTAGEDYWEKPARFLDRYLK